MKVEKIEHLDGIMLIKNLEKNKLRDFFIKEVREIIKNSISEG